MTHRQTCYPDAPSLPPAPGSCPACGQPAARLIEAKVADVRSVAPGKPPSVRRPALRLAIRAARRTAVERWAGVASNRGVGVGEWRTDRRWNGLTFAEESRRRWEEGW